MTRKRSESIVESSGNVFADLGLRRAGEMQIKAELTHQLWRRINSLKLTQSQAAERLGLKQPDVSKLMSGRFTGFSLNRLLALLIALDVDVEIVLRARSGGKGRRAKGAIRVSSRAN
jgi:predicted XRE-type DNA-binding protein